MAIEDIIDARIAEALKDFKPGVSALPIPGIKQRIDLLQDTDGDSSLQPHSVGVDSLAVLPLAALSGAPVIPNGAPTLVTLPTVTYDTAAMSNKTANALTAPVNGIYLAVGYIGWAAGGGARWTYVQATGGDLLGDYRPAPPAADNHRQNVVMTTYLKAGESVTLGAFQNSGAGLATEVCYLRLTFLSNYLQQ